MENQLRTVLQEIENTPTSNITIKEVGRLLDLTLLKTNASEYEIKALAAKASQHQVAAVCVYPQHLQFIPQIVKIPRAMVVNFPGGEESLKHVLKTIKETIHQQHVDEIDYVLPYQTYLHGHRDKALDHCDSIYHFCKDHGITFKIILETGAFPAMNEIYELSRSLLEQGCDFLKTSTGKTSQGATVPAVFAMLAAIKDTQSPCGIKISGGVNKKDQALRYIQLAEHVMGKKVNSHWFRLGASTLLDNLLG